MFILLIVLIPFLSDGQKLHISENKRYLETEDNKPFIWIGDTAWELFHKLNREDAKLYLKDRAARGFTIIQAVVLAEMDGLKKPNAYGEIPLIDMNPEKPNDKYFSHVDFIVDEAQKAGLFIGMLPTWGDKVSPAHGGGPVIFTEANAGTYGRFLGQRYKNKPIVWILGGDRDVTNEQELKVWRALAEGLRKGDNGNHLISFHPRGTSSSHTKLNNEPWLDFNMYQSGHEKHFNEVYRYAETLNAVKPLKPYVDAEAAYEDIAIEFWKYCDWTTPLKVPADVLDNDRLIARKEYFTKGFINAHDVRVAAFWNFLAGACGYTYGNNAIWQMFEKGGDLNIPCLTDWRGALNRPGAGQLKYVRKVFEEYSLAKLQPDQSIMEGTNPGDSMHVRAAMASDHSFAMAYLSQGQPVSINLEKMGKEVTACWYNPRNGKKTKIDNFKKPGIQHFSPPTHGADNDWLLILTHKK